MMSGTRRQLSDSSFQKLPSCNLALFRHSAPFPSFISCRFVRVAFLRDLLAQATRAEQFKVHAHSRCLCSAFHEIPALENQIDTSTATYVEAAEHDSSPVSGSVAGSPRSRRAFAVSLASFSILFTFTPPVNAAAINAEASSSATQSGAGSSTSSKKANVFELKGGVKGLDVRIGSGPVPKEGDTVAIHYYGRLGAKQGWRFDSSYEHKDLFGVPEPYVFTIGSGQVIAGIDTAVRSMHVGGIRRVVIPPDQGYQNKEQGPVPPDFFDRQRLYTTIFNPTRLANGEGATLGTVIFDLELVRIQS